MSDLERRPRSGLSRSAREQRAYRLVMVGGSASLVAVVGFLLAVAGVIGGGIPLIAAIVAVICFVMFRRTVSAR
jgi:putative flippase GtrA